MIKDENNLTLADRLDEFEGENILFHSMIIDVTGQEPLLYSRDETENAPRKLHFLIPEGATYRLTIKYQVRNRALKNLRYVQTVKRFDHIVRERILPVADESPVTQEGQFHQVTFPVDKLPLGMLARGECYANSSFFEGDQLIYSKDWTLEITRKGQKPAKGGY